MTFSGLTWVSAGGFVFGLLAGTPACLLLRKRRAMRAAGRKASIHVTCSGSLGQTGLLDAVRFLEIGGREGILHLLYPTGEKGYLAFQGGRIIDAFFIDRCGKGALFQMLERRDGEFYFEPKTIRHPRLIDVTMMDVALEWDEHRSVAAAGAGKKEP